MNKIYNLTLASIIIVYLVVLAGAIVRMTGSGMGCPDWPKCFGYFIPPTERTQLDWIPNFDYNKNQIIIIEDELFFAIDDFRSADSLDIDNWEKYTKHDYSKFNVYHTWIEYINRLIGAIAGISVLILFITSLKYINKKFLLTFLSFLSLVAILFQAWLGKIVVDSNLSANTISIHMIMAIILLFILFSILSIVNKKSNLKDLPRNISVLIILSIIMLSAQIIIGTEVRKFIDIKMELYNYSQKEKWFEEIPSIFYTHRSFSWIIFILNIYIIYMLNKIRLKSIIKYSVNALIFIQIFTGILMYYLNFPFSTQPIHLLLSTIIIGLQFYFLMLYNTKSNEVKI
ncbi:MAG: COX15/CtaA family protein [Bacteroidetes bacterium]|nr:COX15/CtaA family protein [Cryomorphaceae bacterium]MBL6677474.1 COX15/CtaA family protein [Flavobacteriaceae bacterium]MDA0331326.1 COX15/CtaA family protein [Bacteroidota bacterium]MDA0885690.1 COX15/CtaA family protein [Bacteroidota bacterium]MDA1226075.1 COX15/CtaA family protein [Bacteroidota bacterium]